MHIDWKSFAAGLRQPLRELQVQLGHLRRALIQLRFGDLVRMLQIFLGPAALADLDLEALEAMKGEGVAKN